MQNQSEIETLCGYTDGYTHISSNHEVIYFYSKKEPVTKRLLVGTKGGRVGIGGGYGGGRGQETGERPFIFLLLKLCVHYSIIS